MTRTYYQLSALGAALLFGLALAVTALGSVVNATEQPERVRHLLQFDKQWEGDEIDPEEVKVVISYTVYDKEGEWSPGDKPIRVRPGLQIKNLSEEVTGLPENCTYTSDLPESYTVPGGEEWEEKYQNGAQTLNDSIEQPPVKVETLTVTNTVDCEEPVEVVQAQVTTTPAGPVNAGGAGVLALAGLFGSAGLAGAGLLARRQS